MRTLLSLSLILGSLTLSSFALAEGEGQDSTAPPATSEGAIGIMAGAKVGGIIPFRGLGPNVTGGIEVGYAFPFLKRALAIAVDLDYAAPKASGQENDPRVAGGKYTWHLTQQELNLMPLLMYRMTFLGRIRPYVGVGPRVYFLKSTVRSNVGMPMFQETTEQSTKVGFGVPIGVEGKLGPGALLAEVLLQYGPFDHKATGETNTLGINFAVGYRFLL